MEGTYLEIVLKLFGVFCTVIFWGSYTFRIGFFYLGETDLFLVKLVLSIHPDFSRCLVSTQWPSLSKFTSNSLPFLTLAMCSEWNTGFEYKTKSYSATIFTNRLLSTFLKMTGRCWLMIIELCSVYGLRSIEFLQRLSRPFSSWVIGLAVLWAR